MGSNEIYRDCVKMSNFSHSHNYEKCHFAKTINHNHEKKNWKKIIINYLRKELSSHTINS